MSIDGKEKIRVSSQQKAHIVALLRELENRDDCPAPPEKRIVIFSTQRSGSTFFCRTCEKTELLGMPREFFNPETIYVISNGTMKLDIRAWIEFLERKTTTANGVFSINVHISDYWKLCHAGFDILKSDMDHKIYIFRRDKIAQAHSFLKAKRTGEWSSESKPEAALDEKLVLNTDLLKELVYFSQSSEIYERYVRPKIDSELAYEDFTSDAREFMFTKLFDSFGINPPSTFDFGGGLRKQAQESPTSVERLKQWLFGVEVNC